jgi:hypothetical protein
VRADRLRPRTLAGASAAVRRRVRGLEDRLPERLRRTERWLRDPEFLVTSSSLAFYALVSIPPMILIAVWLAGAVLSRGQLDALVEEIARRSPDGVPAGTVARGVFDLGASSGPFGVLAALGPRRNPARVRAPPPA